MPTVPEAADAEGCAVSGIWAHVYGVQGGKLEHLGLLTSRNKQWLGHEQPLTSTDPGFGGCSDSRMEATVLTALVKPRLP